MASPEAEEIKTQLAAWVETLQTDPPPELDEMRASYAALAELGTRPVGVTWTEGFRRGVSGVERRLPIGT